MHLEPGRRVAPRPHRLRAVNRRPRRAVVVHEGLLRAVADARRDCAIEHVHLAHFVRGGHVV
jgi:hypothetical protein